jgi:uncharacterized protein YdaU (DUF1376 family)
MSNGLYMPLYVTDYLTDAAHLTALEHGAYMLLIMNYWQKGEALPADDRKLARIARMSAAEWEDAGPIIKEFFQEVEGLLRHKRIDDELKKAHEKSAKARQSAQARGANAERTLSERSSIKDKGKEEDIDSIPEIGPNLIEPAPRKAKRAKPKTAITSDVQPTEQDLAYAAENGMVREDVRIEWPKFRNHHISEGNLKADWPAAWRKWCDNWKGWRQKARAGPSNGKLSYGDIARLLPLDGHHERPDDYSTFESPSTPNPSLRRLVG